MTRRCFFGMHVMIAIVAGPLAVHAQTPARAGVPVVRASAATLRLLQDDGSPVPAGASVVTRNEWVPVAMDGFVYLTMAAGQHEARAEWLGQSCTFRFERPEQGDPQPDLGNVTCSTEARESNATDSGS